MIVALDDLPLATGRKVLVQVGTVARPSDWREREAEFTGGDGKARYRGKQIIDTGKMPWMIVPSQVVVTLTNADSRRPRPSTRTASPRAT